MFPRTHNAQHRHGAQLERAVIWATKVSEADAEGEEIIVDLRVKCRL